ncbi:MAG: carboxypeptidase regulatory-like domain-containing protein, partial [Candidatus Thermoplasmatota archaeon]
ETDGTERYFVYYDTAPTPAPGYPDHVSIAESSYFYEPIPGYPLESSFYQITQDGTIRYVVAQKGRFLWYSTSQCVTKLAAGSTEVLPKNGEAIASFEYAYYYGDEMWQYSSTSQELIAKDILYDGNLMVCCRIISGSTIGDLRTTAVYKYYHCPTSQERITVHVVHEALKDCQVYAGANTDGLYASMQCGGIRSASIPDLNFGKIYPYLHFPSEHGTIEKYPVDLTPEYSKENPVLWLIQTPDDVDLGSDAWVSFDEGTTGGVHALLFGSSSVVTAGENERDGISLKAYESNYPHFPGLDYTVASVECTRNTYEKSTSSTDLVIPKGFIAEFDAEFYSSSDGGYPLAAEEAYLFKNLVPLKPSMDQDRAPQDDPSMECFSLMVDVHHAPSFPFGSVLSALTGRSFPYITVEVCRGTTLVRAGTAGRVPLTGSIPSEGSSFRERLSIALHVFDLRNISLWKRFHFQQLEPGWYVIKVFKENPWVGDERRFIGVSIVELTKDSKIHLLCTQQGSCVVSLVDQQGLAITDADVLLLHEGIVIAHTTTNENGEALLTAPCARKDSYQLTALYQGFEVMNESIRLRYNRVLIPLQKSIKLDQYDWTVTLFDLWGLPPEIELLPRLTSTAMQTQTTLLPTHTIKNSYAFTELLPATYHLQVQHKAFSVDKDITIPTQDTSFVFPAEFTVSFHVFDARGTGLDGMVVEMSRAGKTESTTSDGSLAVFSVPPGMYAIKVVSQDSIISQRSVTVVGDRNVDLITNQEPAFPLILIGLSGVLIGIGLLLGIRKKEPLYLVSLLFLGLVIIALVLPWWSLQGSSADVQTSSTFYLIPLNLVSATTTPEVIGGDLTFFPDVFLTIMMIIPIIAVIAGSLALLALVIKRLQKKDLHVFFMIGALVLLFCSLVLFIVTMSAFTEVAVGSLIGNGTIDVSIPGQDTVVSVSCQWGPGVGLWLYVGACVLLLSLCIVLLSQKKKKKNQLL